MIIRGICLFFCLLPFIANAQSPYEIDWRKEFIYLGVGTSTLSAGMYSQYNLQPLQEADVVDINLRKVNRFDRVATTNFSEGAASASDLFLHGSHALPFLFLGAKKTRREFGKISLLYGETLLITSGFTSMAKSLVKRPRPYVYNDEVSIEKKLTKSAQYSFFSGHTSMTTANFFFAAKVFSDYYPDSKLKPYVWTIAALAPAVTGYLRVRAGKHFHSDVIAGYGVGALVGFLVPHLHKVQRGKKVKIMPAPGGVGLTWKM